MQVTVQCESGNISHCVG